MTSTLWRAVEHATIPALGVVSVHPHYPPDNFDWVSPCRYFIRSPGFAAQFTKVTELQAFQAMQVYCSWKKRGPLGESEIIVTDDIGQRHVFFFESFSNSYETLTLAVHQRQHVAVA